MSNKLLYDYCSIILLVFQIEHGYELFGDSLEHFLDGSWVSCEDWAHLVSIWWNITDGWFNAVWNPFDEIR